jgi:phosphoribosylformimino-5-aminoimidazole carboxamide ribotide isomerase
MLVLPAIDIMGGQCVRLLKGRPEESRVYYQDPLDAALRWEQEGAGALHLVDLDRALGGKPNSDAVWRIVDSVTAPVQLGGGLRSREAVKEAFGSGVWRVVMGTAALRSRDLLCWCLDRFGDRVVVALDHREDRVVVSGWTQEHGLSLKEATETLLEQGVREVLATAVERDGTMEGPDLAGLAILVRSGLRVIASGGVTRLEDLRDLAGLPNLTGVVIGRALYEGVLSLGEVLRVSRGEGRLDCERG